MDHDPKREHGRDSLPDGRNPAMPRDGDWVGINEAAAD